MSKNKSKTSRGSDEFPVRGKKSRKDKANFQQQAATDRHVPKVSKASSEPIKARRPKQQDYMNSITHNILTIGTGPAGTGKTFVGCGMACDALKADEIDMIIISRPAVAADEDWAAVPGDINDKYAPYLEPYWETFRKRLGQSKTEYYLKQGRILAAPLGLMRGRTFENCWVFLDEAQNANKKQMELFLTRAGENCRMIVSGDLHQCDLPRDKVSGLRDAMLRFADSPNTGIIEFGVEDIVRSGFAKEVVEAYAKDIDCSKGDRRE